MKILFFLGNGFDLNLGFKSKYSDFYKYYQSIKDDNPILVSLKKDITNKYRNWSDLELALGEYTAKLKNRDEIDIVMEDLGDKLSQYLLNEESKIDFKLFDKEILFDYLKYPERSLLQADQNAIEIFKNKWASHRWDVNIVTFNYTESLEKIIDSKTQITSLGNTVNGHPVVLNNLKHIHGFINNDMVMGVNDISQIKNTNFHEDIDVLETMVKPNCNQAIKHTIDDWTKERISKSNIICIYGSSIGESDNLWWDLIGKRLKDDCQLLIFSRSESSIPNRISQKKQREVRKIIDNFLDKVNLSESEKLDIRSKIYVSINSKMFNLAK